MIKCDQLTSIKHSIWSVNIHLAKLSIYKASLEHTVHQVDQKLDLMDVNMDWNASLVSLSQLDEHTPCALLTFMVRGSWFWLKRQIHIVRSNIFCTMGPKNFCRLSLHTEEPGHTEGIHTLLSFTAAAFVGPRVLLPLWLSQLWSDLLRRLGWWRNLGFSLMKVTAAHLRVHMACWKTHCKAGWDYLYGQLRVNVTLI